MMKFTKNQVWGLVLFIGSMVMRGYAKKMLKDDEK